MLSWQNCHNGHLVFLQLPIFFPQLLAVPGVFQTYFIPTKQEFPEAALNMMTRTCAEDLAMNSGVYMNSVDTGWINDENPLPTAQRIAESHNFQTPIDEIDAAARIVDPVLVGMGSTGSTVGRPKKRGAMAGGLTDGSEGPPWGWFLKDYMQSEPWWWGPHCGSHLFELLLPSFAFSLWGIST